MRTQLFEECVCVCVCADMLSKELYNFVSFSRTPTPMATSYHARHGPYHEEQLGFSVLLKGTKAQAWD